MLKKIIKISRLITIGSSIANIAIVGFIGTLTMVSWNVTSNLRMVIVGMTMRWLWMIWYWMLVTMALLLAMTHILVLMLRLTQVAKSNKRLSKQSKTVMRISN